jgi:hypothetical protein
MFVGGVGNLVLFGILFIYLFLCLWLPQNVQCSLVSICVFGLPKKIRWFLNVLKIFLMMNKFLMVGFGQYDLWGNWTPKLPTTTRGLSCIVHICHTYILHKTSNKMNKQCLITYLLKIDLLENWTPKLPTTSQVICKITLHTYIHTIHNNKSY